MVPSTINTININEIVLTIFKGLHEHYFENDYNNVTYTSIHNKNDFPLEQRFKTDYEKKHTQ